ncbi:MAG: undecaprenyl-diphosphate phosphatase [Alphaproteobacteria bacterium]|jgi:undecaprenyl-diphosphatase|nr:undecaprenyl-diphosphate phosphatase [Alphaproteobacteria bacterium]
MEFLNILILSFVQGMSEFLPISSSGHLVIFQNILQIDQEGSLAFDVALHLGTILAIMVFFYKEVLILLQDSLKFITGKEKKPRLVFQIIASTIPAVVFGFVLIHYNLVDNFRIIPIIAFNLIFFGILLYIIDIKSPQKTDLYSISVKQGFLIGIAQALALIPGVSRSGICITMGRLLQIDKIATIKYGMLISIPSILGAAVLTLFDIGNSNFAVFDFVLGIVFSFIFGLLVIKFLLEFVKRFSFKAFMIYRILLGIIILVYYFY